MLINGILSAEEKKKLASFFQILNQSSQGMEKVIKYANGGNVKQVLAQLLGW